MPNWVFTQMEVRGSEEEVKRFRDGIGEKGFCESYFPCPQELRDTLSGWSSDQAVQAEREKQYEANIAKYGYRDWYDWSCANWGTKWGDCDFQMDDPYDKGDTWVSHAQYNTAWSPAEGALKTISAMFPTLLFITEFDEEGGHFAGVTAYRDGVIIYDNGFVPADYEGELDWENDDSIESFHSWKEAKMEFYLRDMEDTLENLV